MKLKFACLINKLRKLEIKNKNKNETETGLKLTELLIKPNNI